MNTHSNHTPPGEGEVIAYLANRLSDTESQAFEQYCLEHPDFARNVEQELQLKVGLTQLQVSAAAKKKSPEATRPWWPMALAASLLLATLGFLLLWPAAPSLLAFKTMADLPANLRNASITRAALVHVRGGDSTTRVIAPADGVVELRFPADGASQKAEYSFQVTPASSSGNPLVLNHLTAGPDGYVSVYLPASQMAGKSWIVSLKPGGDLQGSSSAQDFLVHFSIPGTPST